MARIQYSICADQLEDPASSNSKADFEKIKRQLSAGTGNVLLQGPLLKRSETLRKWNQRWFTLDAGTGKMEYRIERSDLSARGVISFEADSTITISPVNFHGAKKYDGCCIYISTPHKKEYFLCAETQVAARAWVATIRAAALVLKAHKEAVNSLSGNGAAKLGTVAAVVTAANAVAKEAARDISAEMQSSIKAALTSKSHTSDGGAMAMDNLTIMKETLRVKDEELHQLARELRARDITIRELADRLSETADAAEAAAAAASKMDKQRNSAVAEIERVRQECDERLKASAMELRNGERQRDEALHEAQRWQKELGKAREQMLIMEGGFRRAIAEVEEKLKARDADVAALQLSATEVTAAAAVAATATATAAAVNGGDGAAEIDCGERASNPEEEEAVKSHDMFVAAEREVVIDTCSPEA